MKLVDWMTAHGHPLAYVAYKLEASPSTVFKWLAGEFKPSKILMKRVIELTNGCVTLKDFEEK